jgi:predicted DNA-binding helix-hairpin-helix protein
MTTVHRSIEVEDQVKALMVEALDDQEGPGKSGSVSLRAYAEGKRERGALDPLYIRDLIVPGVGNRRIFRILLTNACKYSCDYCPMRAQRDLPRHALEPASLARIFMITFRRGWCDGLFVTSGIPRSPAWAMEKMLELVETLRFTHGYRGYLHVKVMAGAEPGQVERLVRLVDRVSYNLEAACQRSLAEHAPEKNLAKGIALLQTAKKAAEEIREARRTSAKRAPSLLPPPDEPMRTSSRFASGGMGAGATTQFVVGLGNETDRDLLSLAQTLERNRLIHHPQFAAFRPIKGTPLENRPATPALRERRLYQADHLLRQYGFSADELVYDRDGKLPLDLDPKLRWALDHPEKFPVELTTATREDLQRVPGFGPRTVERILQLRAGGFFRDLRDLRELGAVVGRAAGFVTCRGRLLGTRQVQPLLFEPPSTSVLKSYDVSPGTFR